MRLTPASELEARYKKLQVLMEPAGLDAVLMIQSADLFYFTGSVQQGALYVPVSGEPLYLVRKDHGRARMECGLREVHPFKSPKEIPGRLADFGHPSPKRLGMELDVVPVALFQRFQAALPEAKVSDATPLIRTVRAVKSAYEIDIMKDAALQVDKVYQRAKEVIRVGITDLELAAELEFVARKEGHQGITRMRAFNNELFFGHIFSGADSAAPAFLDTPLGGMGVNPSIGQGASYKTIKANEPIIVDFAGAFDGYLVDQTRVFCIGGLPEPLHGCVNYGFDNAVELIANPHAGAPHAFVIRLNGVSLVCDCQAQAAGIALPPPRGAVPHPLLPRTEYFPAPGSVEIRR